MSFNPFAVSALPIRSDVTYGEYYGKDEYNDAMLGAQQLVDTGSGSVSTMRNYIVAGNDLENSMKWSMSPAQLEEAQIRTEKGESTISSDVVSRYIHAHNTMVDYHVSALQRAEEMIAKLTFIFERGLGPKAQEIARKARIEVQKAQAKANISQRLATQTEGELKAQAPYSRTTIPQTNMSVYRPGFDVRGLLQWETPRERMSRERKQLGRLPGRAVLPWDRGSDALAKGIAIAALNDVMGYAEATPQMVKALASIIKSWIDFISISKQVTTLGRYPAFNIRTPDIPERTAMSFIIEHLKKHGMDINASADWKYMWHQGIPNMMGDIYRIVSSARGAAVSLISGFGWPSRYRAKFASPGMAPPYFDPTGGAEDIIK